MVLPVERRSDEFLLRVFCLQRDIGTLALRLQAKLPIQKLARPV